MILRKYLIGILLALIVLLSTASAAPLPPLPPATPTSCGVINTAGTLTVTAPVSSTGTCFSINTSGVTLDCGGNTITFGTSGVGFDFGVEANDVTIRAIGGGALGAQDIDRIRSRS